MKFEKCFFGKFSKACVVFALVVVAVCFGAAGEAEAQGRRFRTVVVDAGHGGADKGRISQNVYFEKIYTLDVALKLERILERAGFQVVMTRRSDRTVSLAQRAALANGTPGAIFVSVHFNAAPHAGVRGIESYYAGPAGNLLAARVHRSVVRRTQGRDRGTRMTDFYVLRNTRTAAVLVEGGFMSNASELSQIQSARYRERMAQGIADGIVAYRDSLGSAAPKPKKPKRR